MHAHRVAVREMPGVENDCLRHRHLVDVDADELAPWTRLMRSREMRTLCAAVLGVPTMPETIVLNAWHLAHGDTMSVHPDGKRYTGTLSLGLSHDWTAADGGAILVRHTVTTSTLTRAGFPTPATCSSSRPVSSPGTASSRSLDVNA